MQSGRLRFIWSSAAVTTALVVLAATTAGAVGTLGDEKGVMPPTALGCEAQPGPIAQTVAYAHCQTVATMDGAMAMACDFGVTC